MASKTLASLIVRIGADVTGVTAGLNTLDKRVRSTKKQFSTVTDSTLRWQSALGVLAGAAGIGYAAKKIFDLGAGVEETASKFRTVFGASTQQAQKFLDEFANTAGLTNTQGRELLATTGAIAQGMGFSGKASAAFAQEITKLSGDLSSFNNVPIAETSRAIQSALTGERESLKRLGIVILEADVQQKALAMTGKANAKALTQQEKATATLALITERAGVAVGDLARTMDSPANRARKIIAQFGDLRDSIAHGLLPAMGAMLEEIGNSVGGMDRFGQAVEQNRDIIAAWARFAVEAFKFAAKAMAALITTAFHLGEVIGNAAQVAFYWATKNYAAAVVATQAMMGAASDIRGTVDGLIESFDAMRIASGEAWKAQATIADAANAAAAAFDRETTSIVALTAAQRQLLMIGTGVTAPNIPGFTDEAKKQRANRLRGGLLPGPAGVTVDMLPFGLGEDMKELGLGIAGKRGAGRQLLSDPRLSKAGGILGTLGQVLPGKLGSVASSAGAVASAFASGGPLLGGIALAGAAFKGISSLFDSGRSRIEEFINSVRAARQTLDAQFGLLDIEDATRRFALTLAQAQSVFEGTSFESFFRGLTLENIQERIDAILNPPPGKAKFDLGTDTEMGKAFLDFIMRLETIGDSAESNLDQLADTAKKATESLRNVPSGFKVALARFNASDAVIRTQSTATTGSRTGFTPALGPAQSRAGNTFHIGTINVTDVKDPKDFMAKLERQVRWQQRTGSAVFRTATV